MLRKTLFAGVASLGVAASSPVSADNAGSLDCSKADHSVMPHVLTKIDLATFEVAANQLPGAEETIMEGRQLLEGAGLISAFRDESGDYIPDENGLLFTACSHEAVDATVAFDALVHFMDLETPNR